jgi:hypothetical protein
MINIRFQTGRNQQAIYSGQCECGNVLTFTPGGNAVICVKCGRRWVTDVTAIADVVPSAVDPKIRRAAGPGERKIRAIV